MSALSYVYSRLDDESLVEFGKAVGKAEEKKYRSSHLAGINPRSKTEVRPGAASAARRAGRWVGGQMVGATTGGLVGSVGGAKGRSLGTVAGGYVGGSVGRTYNLKSGDTRATHRSSGKKATGAISLPSVGNYWMYGKEKVGKAAGAPSAWEQAKVAKGLKPHQVAAMRRAATSSGSGDVGAYSAARLAAYDIGQAARKSPKVMEGPLGSKVLRSPMHQAAKKQKYRANTLARQRREVGKRGVRGMLSPTGRALG